MINKSPIGSPAKRAMRAGKKEGVLGEGIFVHPLVLGGGWACVRRRRTHRSDFGVGVLFKISSNFVQKTPILIYIGLLVLDKYQKDIKI